MQASLQITETDFQREVAQPGSSKSRRAYFVARRINTILLTSAVTRASLWRQATKEYGIGENLIERMNYVIRHGTPDILEQLEAGTITVYAAYVATNKSKPPPKKRTPAVKMSEKALRVDQERLDIIEAPSIYPTTADWPFDDHPNTVHLRQAIVRLHELEPSIAFMKKREAEAFQILVNTIPAYVANYHNYPRPDGPLDPRWVAWSSSLWRKLQNQFRRLADKPARRPAATVQTPLSFERRFRDFWLVIEPQIDALFTKSDKACFARAMRKAVAEYFHSETEPSDETAPAESQTVAA